MHRATFPARVVPLFATPISAIIDGLTVRLLLEPKHVNEHSREDVAGEVGGEPPTPR